MSEPDRIAEQRVARALEARDAMRNWLRSSKRRCPRGHGQHDTNAKFCWRCGARL